VAFRPAQTEGKEEFLTEFAQVYNKCKGAAVIGGYFNTEEKNKAMQFT
jgi:hypothetical protein